VEREYGVGRGRIDLGLCQLDGYLGRLASRRTVSWSWPASLRRRAPVGRGAERRQQPRWTEHRPPALL